MSVNVKCVCVFNDDFERVKGHFKTISLKNLIDCCFRQWRAKDFFDHVADEHAASKTAEQHA